MGPEGVWISEIFGLEKCTFFLLRMHYILCRVHWNIYEYY